ncbi:MAG: CHAT domain-containing protein, partial [Chlorobi bacterium]|nr:CHAT domain-containing protein [Chlorobiota bacterium]
QICLLLFATFFLFNHVIKSQNLKIADKYYEAEQYKKAAHEYEKILPELKNKYGANDTSVYAKALFRAGNSFYENNLNINKAEKYYEEGVNIYKSIKNGKEDFWFILFANSLSFLYQKKAEQYAKNKNYVKAEKQYLKLINFDVENFGKHNISYPYLCRDLADIYVKKKEYNKAEHYYNEALKIEEELYGEDSWHFRFANRNMAIVYTKQGKYKEAERFYKEAIQLKEKFSDNDDILKYADACTKLASIYLDIGNYKDAEIFFIKAKNKRGEVLGKNNLKYAESCNYLARLYFDLGNYTQAEKLFIEAKSIRENIVGKEHPDYAQSCNNLGVLYHETGDLDKALAFYTEAFNIRAKTLGTKSKEYATSCNNIATIYFAEGKYKDAEELVITAKNILAELSTNNLDYIRICNHLGSIYEYMKLYDKAEALFLEAKSIQEENLGKNNTSYLEICKSLARIYEIKGNKNKALKCIKEANKTLIFLLNESAKYMSEKEREKYLENILKNNFDIIHSFYLKREKNNKKDVGTVYNNILNLKSELLKSSINMRKAVLQSGDSVLINKLGKMNNYGEIIAEQYTLPVKDRRTDIQELEKKLNKLEKELISYTASKPLYKNYFIAKPKWEDIKKTLKKDEVAIEFTHFNYANVENWTDSILYYALIVRKDYKYPKAVFLFEQKQLQKIINRPENINEYEYIKELYDIKSPKADRLYKLIWQPLEIYLQNSKKIYISPSGLLNKISFDAIPVKSSKIILSDKYKIIYNTSTAQLTNNTELYKNDIKDVVLFGGLEYDVELNKMKTNSDNFKTNKPSVFANNLYPEINFNRSFSQNISWNYLPGTLEEIEDIKEVIKKNDFNVTTYKDEFGTEEQFKALESNAPSVLHISTHGFYFGENKNNPKSKETTGQLMFFNSENPLLRSGLILAGGNLVFQGKNIPKGVEDGVLTAAEISQLNFFNTKLAVLSACQTGLGDIKDNEGVYGLQRAFKMAGVEYLIYSLWEVPDGPTKELMTEFYKNWFSGIEIHEAFKKAQNHLKTKYAKVEGGAFAWAAFVLIM